MRLIFSSKNFFIWGLIFFWVGVGLVSWAHSAELIDKTVAVVNGKVITQRQLEQGKFLNQENENWGIEDMIDRRLLLQEAERKKITIEPETLESSLSNIRKNFSEEEFNLILKEAGLSLKEYREWIKGILLQFKLINQKKAEINEKTRIEEEELEDFYQKLKQYLQGEEAEEEIEQFCYIYGKELKNLGKVKIALIVISNKDEAENIFQLLKRGFSFSLLARGFSQGPNIEGGGELDFLRPEDLVSFLKEALSSMKTGEIKLIEKENLFYIIQLKERKELLFSQWKPRIENYLRQKKIEKALQEWLETLRKEANIIIVDSI